MSSGPPPRKKSRYFPDGNSRIGTILRGIVAQRNAANQSVPSRSSSTSSGAPGHTGQPNNPGGMQALSSPAAGSSCGVTGQNNPTAQNNMSNHSTSLDDYRSNPIIKKEQPAINVPMLTSRPSAFSSYSNIDRNDRPARHVRFASVRPDPESGDEDTDEPESKRTSLGESAFSALTVRDTRRDGITSMDELMKKGGGKESVKSAALRGSSSSTTAGAAFGNNSLSNMSFKTPSPPPPPPPPSEPEPERQGPPYEVYRILKQDYDTAAKDSKRTGRPLMSYFEKFTMPNEPFWTSADVRQALAAVSASRMHTYRIVPAELPLVGTYRPGLSYYTPLAQGYQTHPVHGQLPLPTAEDLTRLQQQKLAQLSAEEAAKASNSSVNTMGAFQLPHPDPNPPAPSMDPVKAQPFLPRPNRLIDLRRDSHGNLISPQATRPIPNLRNRGITHLPFHATLTPTRRPTHPTLYTSPNRMKFALAAASSRKRKRADAILPPPAYVHIHTGDPHFSVFAHILLYPELVFHLAAALTVADLITLYSISRDFHTIIDTRLTTVILSQSLAKAPDSSRTFAFRSYRHLCRPDPAARIPHPDPILAAEGRPRLVPSFRWLRMVLHREKAVHEIMALFAEEGLPLPPRCALALKRLWFLLDIPDNARRIGFVHARALFTDLDLYFAMAVFVKLDMRCNDPVAPECRAGLRKLLLGQPTLTTLLRVLKRDVWRAQLDVLQAWIRYKYAPADDEAGLPIFGIPATHVGRGCLEYWGLHTEQSLGRVPQTLLRPDQLVMREAVRRGIRFHKHFLRCMLYGYVRPDTLENAGPRDDCARRIAGLEAEYGVDDEVGGAEVPEGGMRGDILDMGGTREVSLFCVRKELREDERARREQERRWVGLLYEWSSDEREDLMDVDG